MEPVHILVRRDRIDHRLFIDLRRQGQLHQNAVHAVIIIQRVYNKIPIEERNPKELSYVEGVDEDNKVKKVRIYSEKSKVMNLAFDITPAKYVTGLITEKGVCEASEKGLKGLFK